ncbi:MAG: hypothetical protein N3A53_04695, partial [Verrucomicrobiae bacterium]|nr:hypothetical protein [Verrucomicrobiae bacterium]
VRVEDNDGRIVVGYLPELVVAGAEDPVVQVVNEKDGDILYTRRISGMRFRPPVYEAGTYTVKIGRDKPDLWKSEKIAVDKSGKKQIRVNLAKSR